MKLYAHLLLAAFALHARAATIPEKILPEEFKIDSPSENPKGPIENIFVEQELLDKTNIVKDVENNLRVKTIEDIPVKVVVEDVPMLKTSEEGNEVPQEQLKKICEEVRDPGTPQRQEHETQNPEHHVDALTLKQAIQDTQTLLRQGLQEVSEGINSFVANNEHSAVKDSIHSLQKGFGEKIQQINNTIRNLLKHNGVEVQDNVEETQIRTDLKAVENRLHTLESNFNEGINNLAKGVAVMTALKAEGDNAESSSTAAPGTNVFSQMVSSIQALISNMTANLQQLPALSNQQTPPSGSQSDPEGTTTSGPFFQNWFPFNIFNQNQNQQILPIFGNIPNMFVPSTAKPAEADQKPNEPSKPVENKEPEKKPVSSAAGEPEKEPESKPEEQPQKNTGPIRQILERNPIVQGISGAVQRLQHNIYNPEKPRGAEKKEPEKVQSETIDPMKIEPNMVLPEKVEPVKVEPAKGESEKQELEKTEEDKGLLLLDGHGGHHGGSGDNIDSRGGLKEELAKEPSAEIPKDEPVQVQEKTE